MATDHNFKVKNGLDVLGGRASIAASGTNNINSLKLHVGTINSTGSSAIAQFGGFIRASEYYILHETTGSGNSLFIDYVGNDLDIRAGEGNYTGFIRANGYKVGTTTVIDSSRNLSNIGSISSGTITSTGNIVGVGINSTSNYTELGSTSASNLVFKRTNASYIQADGSGGYFIFITNGRSTSYANRALALTTDNNAEFGGSINTVGNVTVGGNLTVNGTTTTLNTATLNVEDKNIVLNYGSGDTSSTANGAGIRIQDAVNSSTDATMSWDASDDRFEFSHMISVQGGGIRAIGAGNDNTAYSGVFKNLAGDNVLLVRNDKRVLIPGGYLYVNNSEGIYSTGAIRARGGITNDGGNNLSISSGGSAITFNSKNLTNVGTISSGGITTTSGVTIGGGLTTGTINVNAQNATTEGGEIVLLGAGSNEDINIDNYSGNFRVFDGTAPQVRLSLDTSGNATFAGTISSGAITSSGTITSDQFTSASGDVTFRRGGSSTARILIESGSTTSGQNFIVNGTIKTHDGTPSAPTYSFSSDTNTGMYRNSADILGFATGGARRAYFASSGIHSDANVYAINDFRNYGGAWRASTGVTGNGFSFINSVDGTAMTLSSTGVANFTGNLTAPNLIASTAIKIAGTQVISSSRALTNITSINATGAIETSSQLASYQGNVSNSFANTSIRLGYSGSANYQQAIKSRHNSGTGAGNAIDFFLWNSGTDAIGDIGTLRVASFETSKGLDIVDGGLQIDGTTVVTSLRNLTNVGTISSGAITSTGRSTFDSVTIDDDGSGSPLLRVVGDDHSPWLFQLENASASNDGLFQAYINNSNNLYFRAKETGAYPTWYFQIGNGSNNVDSMYLNSSGINSAGHVNGASFKVSSTTVIDSGRNLLSIGSISASTLTTSGDITVNGNDISMAASNARVKYRVWSNDTYGIGMHNSVTYGGINTDYAMTFQMNNDADRGFLWFDSDDTLAQGAMALTTEGKLTVAGATRMGFGKNDTTAPATYNLNVNQTFAVTSSVGNPVTIGADSTYGTSGTGRYVTLGFGGITNGSNRIFAHNTGEDHIYLAAATGKGIVMRTNGSGSNTFHFTSAGNFQIGATTVISSGRGVENVILQGGTTGARFQSSNWIYDDDNDGRLYFAINGPTYYKSTTGHRFRANGDVTRLTIDAAGAVNLISGGDTNAPGGSALAVSGTVLLTDDRRLLATEGTNSAPSISFAADTNTGIYRSGTDEVSITNAGTQRFVFGYDSNGARLKMKGIGSNAVGDFVITSTNNATNGLGYTNYVLGVNIEDSTTNGMPEQRSVWGGVSGAAAIALGADDTSSSASAGPITFLSSPQGSSAGTALTVRGFFKDDGDLRLNHDLQVLGTVTATQASGSSFKGPIYITAQNTSGEGGEITLNGSNGNTQFTLDTVNGYFRIFDTSGTFISGNSGYGLNAINGYRVNGTQVINASRVLQNVTANANIITSGTISGDRIPNLSGDKITAVTTLSDTTFHDVVVFDGTGLKRDTAVEIHGSGYLKAVYLNMTHSAGNRTGDDVFYSSNDSYIRKNTASGFRTSLDVYSKSESVALFTDTGDIDLGAGSVLTRSNHHTGHMEGSYNNIGNHSAKSNPIYTIGSGYNPSDAALGNMYGIGFAKKGNATYLGDFRQSGWGMYVASDGDARVFLNAQTGVVASTAGYDVGATNVIDSSRNLANIGTITASGTVNLSGALLSTNAGANAIKTRFISGAASSSTSDGNLYVQHGKTNNILCFNSTSGNPQFQIYGNDSGTQRSGTLQIGTDGSFNISASDTYLILNAANYIQSNDSHNFIGNIMIQGTAIVTTSRQLQNVTVTSAEAEGGHSLNGNFGQFENHGTYSNFDTDVNYWGWSFVQGSTNAPHTASSQWYRNRVGLGNGYGFQSSTNDYWLEVASPRLSPVNGGHMYIRQCENGNIGPWYEVGSILRSNLNVGTKTSADINLGATTTNARLIIRKADDNTPDHIQIFCGGTQTGQIGSQDTTWLRINQNVAKNIYTPRYIRADGGLFVDGAAMGVDGSGRIRGFAGSNSAVGIGFATDTNTGFTSPSADNLGFVTGGALRANLSGAKLTLKAGLGLDLETSTGNVRGLIGAFESAPHLRISTSNNESIGFYDGGTSGTQNVDISGAGALTVRDNVTAYGSFSDIRLKENIEAIPDAIQKVQKLEGVTFNYKKDGSRSTGLIAQQLQEVLPEVVYETKDLDTQETHYAVRYGNVVGLLVEAIKEQQTQLTAQQEQINQLTNLVNTLMEK